MSLVYQESSDRARPSAYFCNIAACFEAPNGTIQPISIHSCVVLVIRMIVLCPQQEREKQQEVVHQSVVLVVVSHVSVLIASSKNYYCTVYRTLFTMLNPACLWSAEKGKENKQRSLAARPFRPPPPLLGRKKKKITHNSRTIKGTNTTDG